MYGVKDNQITDLAEDEIDVQLESPNAFFGSHINLIPIQNAVQGPRLFYGARFYNQALPVINSEAPLVQNLVDGDDKGRSFDQLFGKDAGAVFAPEKGRVLKVDPDFIEYQTIEGNTKRVDLYNQFPFNRKSVTGDSEILIKRGRSTLNMHIDAYTYQEGDRILSINPDTLVSEWALITGFLKHTNDKRLLRVEYASGHFVNVTEDHSLITLGSEGRLVPIYPKNCNVGITESPIVDSDSLSITWSRIKSMSEIPHELYVYDFEVAGNQNFAVNGGLLVHNTSIHNTPLLKEGDEFDAGSVLAKSNYTDNEGTLALGVNARVGLVPFRGFSMDDAIVISEDFAKKLSGEHTYTTVQDFDGDTKGGRDHFTNLFPMKYKKSQLETLDEHGVVKPGTILHADDPMILATMPRVLSSSTSQIGKLSKVMRQARRDASVVWEHEDPGEVIDVVHGKKGVKVMTRAISSTKDGDKLVFRTGQKGINSKIISNDRMPRTVDGRPLDVLLNPLGVPSRANNSIIYEILLGKLAEATGKPVKVPGFNGKDEKWYGQVMQALEEAGISDVEEVFDPETNKKLQNPITVGNAYVLKLHHTGECFDEETEVLTQSGWKFWRDVTMEDEIATTDPRGNKLFFEKPLHIMSYDYDGLLYGFEGRYVDYLVTPNHNMWCGRSGDFSLTRVTEVHGKKFDIVQFDNDFRKVIEVGAEGDFRTVQYKGKVYCAEMSSGLLYVRRNGKPMLSGNSKQSARGQGAYSCYDSDTEVLTNRGWVAWPDVKDNDELFTPDISDNTATYKKPLRLVEYDYDGDLLGYRSTKLDFLVTPNHKFASATAKVSEWRDRDAQTLRDLKFAYIPKFGCRLSSVNPGVKIIPAVPASRKRSAYEGDLQIDFEDYVHLCAWWASEGSIDEDNRLCIWQSLEKNPEKFEEIRLLILRITGKEPWNFYDKGLRIQDPRIGAYFKQFGSRCFNKYLPADIVSLSGSLARTFIDTFASGDGSHIITVRKDRGGKIDETLSIYSSSVALLDQIQIIAIHAGIGFQYHLSKAKGTVVKGLNTGKYISQVDNYAGNIYLQNTRAQVVSKRLTESNPAYKGEWYQEAYKGKVYCATTDTGYLCVRRNGKVMISGNSDDQPLKGGGENAQSKRLSGLEIHSLLSAGAYKTLREGSTLRGQRNDEYWRLLRQGYNPKPMNEPFVWKKFQMLLQGAGLRTRDKGDGRLRLGPMTDKDLDEYKPLEVRTEDLVDPRTLDGKPGGLFDPALVGGNGWGEIRLPFQVPNPAFERQVATLLGVTLKDMRAVLAGEKDLDDVRKR